MIRRTTAADHALIFGQMESYFGVGKVGYSQAKHQGMLGNPANAPYVDDMTGAYVHLRYEPSLGFVRLVAALPAAGLTLAQFRPVLRASFLDLVSRFPAVIQSPHPSFIADSRSQALLQMWRDEVGAGTVAASPKRGHYRYTITRFSTLVTRSAGW